MIDKFDGEYRFLSNFWPSKVFLHNGIEFPTVENAYQAAKTLDQDERLSFKYLTPGQAKRHGREITLRQDWEDVKYNIMEILIFQKFSDLELREKLAKTYPEELVEGNTWNDIYWGVCNGKGLNKLGKILMIVRDHILFGDV